jgi:hypothetical protein
MKYLDIDWVIDEDLYELTINYNKNIKSNEDLKENAKIAIENSKVDIPELFNEEREYPPFLYYIVLSMLNRRKTYEKWSKLNKTDKLKIVDECYSWLNSLVEEIREPNESELELLINSKKTVIKID